MSKNNILLHHLGMGDHFHCNGMVRHLVEDLDEDDKLVLFCWERNKKNVEYMYRDEKRIVVVPIENGIDELSWVDSYIDSFDGTIDDVLINGYSEFSKIKKQHPEYTCDQCFYKQFDIPYEYRFSKFYYERDYEEEDRVFNKLIYSSTDSKDTDSWSSCTDGPYVFVHDIPEKNYKIDINEIHTKYHIIKNDITESIFNFRKILENASEIHCIESSFRCFVEGIDTSNSAHYFHEANTEFKRYDREGLKMGTSKDWNYLPYD